MSRLLEKLPVPSFFFEADTSTFLASLNQNSFKFSTLAQQWNLILTKAHSDVLLALHERRESEGARFWIVCDDDMFIHNEFHMLSDTLAENFAADTDCMILAGDSIISPLAIRSPSEFIVPVEFPSLLKLAAYAVPASRLAFVATAISNNATDCIVAKAYLTAPPILFEFRDDILPCVLRQNNHDDEAKTLSEV
jgi:hypothetical protein